MDLSDTIIPNSDQLRADLVALAERTVRAHFDGEVL